MKDLEIRRIRSNLPRFIYLFIYWFYYLRTCQFTLEIFSFLLSIVREREKRENVEREGFEREREREDNGADL